MRNISILNRSNSWSCFVVTGAQINRIGVSMRTLVQCGLILFLLPLSLTLPRTMGPIPAAHPIDLTNGDLQQYAFLTPLLKDIEVVSLAESIHMTHEFPLVRIGMVRWMNQHLGYGMLAVEGSPEDVWVSQDAFLHAPSNLSQSTSGLFGIWNTTEMKQLFAYEASTWTTSHPLYITSYDIQPGTGRLSQGDRVFSLLQQTLMQYAPPAPGFDAAAWTGNLSPLTSACSLFKKGDEARVTQAIGVIQEWIGRAAPSVETRFPSVPHATALRLIPENLRASLALCEGMVSHDGSAGTYKTARDKNAALFALRLKEAAPQRRLILWAHISHLFYDADGMSTSVGELLHASLGKRLYTIGTLAQGGGAIMLFNDWNRIVGYGRVWGVSASLKQALGGACPSICFFDLQNVSPGSMLSRPQHIWFEASPLRQISLSRNFDGIVWVKHVHPLQMPLLSLLAYSSPRYIGILAAAFLVTTFFLIMLVVLICRNRRTVS
jgi:erythromycin esterase-like protein